VRWALKRSGANVAPWWEQLCVAGLWGGLLALERRAFLQAMFSRPLVAATGMGFLLGDLQTGLFVGLLLELFHLGGAALGAALPDHDTLAATTASAAAVLMAPDGDASPAMWSLSVLLCGGGGGVGRLLERGLERHTSRLARLAQRSAEEGELRRAMRQNLWGMWSLFSAFAVVTMLGAGLGLLLARPVAALPDPLLNGLALAYPAMLSVSAACAAKGSRARQAGYWAGLGGLLVALWMVARRLSEGT